MKASVTKQFELIAAVLAMASAAAPAHAHHSHAMFDTSKKLTLSGTVKDFQWTNPHIWLQLMVPDAKTGTLQEWSLEGATPVQLVRRGWRASSLKPGDKVTVTASPLRDGAKGGSLGQVTRSDGTVVGEQGARAD